MAEYAQVSKHQVTAIWKAADLKPHRIRSFKISNDPDFAEKVIDVVGLYMDPPENALVLSVDEKLRFRLWTEPSPCFSSNPGRSNAEPTTTNATGRPVCLPPSTWPAVK